MGANVTIADAGGAGRRLGFVDVGARDGLHAGAARHADRVECVLVEPDLAEAHRLAEVSDGVYSVLPAGLAHVDGPTTLYVTSHPACSSALRPNTAFVQGYPVADAFRPATETTIECSRYDTLHAAGRVPDPDIVKVDVQGFEHQVLLGFGGLLRETLAVEVESHFYPLYHGQKLITDVVEHLAGFDLRLRSIRNSRSPGLRGDPHFGGDLVEVDALFTRSRAWYERQDSAVQEEFQLACSVLGIDPY